MCASKRIQIKYKKAYYQIAVGVNSKNIQIER